MHELRFWMKNPDFLQFRGKAAYWPGVGKPRDNLEHDIKAAVDHTHQ